VFSRDSWRPISHKGPFSCLSLVLFPSFDPSPTHNASRFVANTLEYALGRGGAGGYQCRSSKCTVSAPDRQPFHSLVVGLLGHDLLGLILLGLQEAAKPLQNFRSKDEGSGDGSLATSNIAIAATLLVLGAVGIESPVLGLGSLGEGPVDQIRDGLLNVFCLGLDDGHTLVNLGQELVTDLVGLSGIGLRVGGRSLEVGESGLDEFGVASIGHLDRFGAIGVALEVGDAVANGRV